MTGMVHIEIAPLHRGLNTIELRPSADDLDLDPAEFSEIVVDSQVDVRADRILVRFSVASDAHMICDRTLRPFTERVSGSYAVLLSAQAEVAADDVDDVRVFSPSDRAIDISDAIRDTLILALPARRLAPGADEVEIPDRFGDAESDSQPDPRWEALRRLQK